MPEVRHEPRLRDPEELRRHCIRKIARRERLMMACLHANREPATLFLENFAQNGPVSRGMPALPMTGRTLPDHFGMKFEAVSRRFTALRAEGVIAMEGTCRYALGPAKMCWPAAA